MADYWTVKMEEAQKKGRSELSSELRDVYLQLGEHYRAMALRLNAKP